MLDIQNLKSDSAALSRLTRILELTSSSHENEVVIAARKAREMMARYNCNFQDLLSVENRTDNREEIERLRQQVQLQNQRIRQLEAHLCNAQRQAAEKPQTGSPKFLGTVTALKNFLLANFQLRSHEVKLLEPLDMVKPKTKEAYMVLICARRYGVCFQDQ